jgi:ATP-dependent protease Clp ATPase subunit
MELIDKKNRLIKNFSKLCDADHVMYCKTDECMQSVAKKDKPKIGVVIK